MIPLFAIRPEPGCTATVTRAQTAGFAAEGWPLFTIAPCDWQVPAMAFDAILAGSANVFRHGGDGLAELRGLLVHAVGPSTAEAAQAAGFRVASVGTGGLQALLDRQGQPLSLLRLTGTERVALDLKPDTVVTEVPVYSVIPQSIPQGLAARLANRATVLLHSAAAARHFAAECERIKIDRTLIGLAAIGPRVAKACGTGWRSVGCAASPDDAALLVTARSLCQ